MGNGLDGGDNTRMNLIIAAAMELVDDVLDQARMVLELSDHSMQRTVENGLVERDSAIIDESLEISPRRLINGMSDDVVYSDVELSQYHSSESVISDHNLDYDNTDGNLHLPPSAAVQFDSARELVATSTRYFHGDRPSLNTGVASSASADQVNGTGINFHENRQPIELPPISSLCIGLQVPAESPTSSDNEEKTWVSDLKQMWPSELQPNYSSNERELWPSADEEETMVVLPGINEAGNDTEEVVPEPTPKKRRSFWSALGRRILSAGRKLCCCGGGSHRVRRSNDIPLE